MSSGKETRAFVAAQGAQFKGDATLTEIYSQVQISNKVDAYFVRD